MPLFPGYVGVRRDQLGLAERKIGAPSPRPRGIEARRQKEGGFGSSDMRAWDTTGGSLSNASISGLFRGYLRSATISREIFRTGVGRRHLIGTASATARITAAPAISTAAVGGGAVCGRGGRGGIVVHRIIDHRRVQDGGPRIGGLAGIGGFLASRPRRDDHEGDQNQQEEDEPEEHGGEEIGGKGSGLGSHSNHDNIWKWRHT